MQSSSYIAGMLSLPKISAAILALGFVGLGGASGCLYDSGDRCDPGQTYDPGSGLCICGNPDGGAVDGGGITGDHGCVPCGEHEVAVNDMCVCIKGYQKPSGATTCAIIPDGLGDVCTANTDCTASAVFTTCQPSGASGYCTNSGCATDDDCAGGYACNTTASPTFCQRPPTGQDMACKSSADCAGNEASYCLTIQANTCFVECTIGGSECFSGRSCCDLQKLSGGLIPKQLCTPTGTCHL
jgi:hypothetical protein